MWVVVVVLLFLLGVGWTRREGWTGEPADAADQQTGELRFMQTKIAGILEKMSPELIEKYTVDVGTFESKVSDLEVKMTEFNETKKVNDTMGYPSN
jgi:hypothetical protein